MGFAFVPLVELYSSIPAPVCRVWRVSLRLMLTTLARARQLVLARDTVLFISLSGRGCYGGDRTPSWMGSCVKVSRSGEIQQQAVN